MAFRSRSVLIRVDSGADIGSGHVQRCLSLARKFRARGVSVTFACRERSGNYNALIDAAGFELIALPASRVFDEMTDAQETLRALKLGDHFNLVIVDSYDLGSTWESQLRKVADNILVIDDLANRTHDCDFLVDVAPVATNRYFDLVPKGCVNLVGTRYTLIRPEFSNKRRIRDGSVGALARILISFGGVDATNMTGRAFRAAKLSLPSAQIHAVLTGNSPYLGALQHLASIEPNLHLHVDVQDMAELMADADLAIGAGGTTSWERACVGLPSIVAAIAENQIVTTEALASNGCAVVVSGGESFDISLGEALRLLDANPGLIRMMSTAALALVDGKGVDRIVNTVFPIELTLRRATRDDARQIWRWRNSPEIRKTALDDREISWDDHERWFMRRIDDPRYIMLVAADPSGDVGTVRFDIDGPTANVSIFLAPDRAGDGLGSELLRCAELWLEHNNSGVRRFSADIRPENLASIGLFRRRNYTAHHIRFERNLDV